MQILFLTIATIFVGMSSAVTLSVRDFWIVSHVFMLHNGPDA